VSLWSQKSKKRKVDWMLVENDCIAILEWFYKHPYPPQSVNKCANETGIPEPTVRFRINEYDRHGTNCILFQKAHKFGYYIEYIGKRSRGKAGHYIFVDKIKPSWSTEIVHYNEDFDQTS